MHVKVYFNARDLTDEALTMELYATAGVEDSIYQQVGNWLFLEAGARSKGLPGATVLLLEVSQEVLQNLMTYCLVLARVAQAFARRISDPPANLTAEGVRGISQLHLRILESFLRLIPDELQH